jgi:ribonuclease/clavin/mitogillin
MGEVPPGRPPSPVAIARDASAVVLKCGREVFWVQRGQGQSFFAGFRAFPGGRVDESDRALPVSGVAPETAVLLVCAVRELFEETGVLVVRGAERLSARERSDARRRLLAGTLSFADLLASGGLSIDAAALLPAGRWITPPFLSQRYDARLFLVDLPAGQDAEVWPGELASGEWVLPEAALVRWARGETLLHPPNLNALRALSEETELEPLLARLRAPQGVRDFISDRIEFQQGFHLFPVRTPTLPPATHTNTMLLGNGELLVVDPGASDPLEQQRLEGHLRTRMAEGLRPVAIVLTHHHFDHCGGVEALRTAMGLPVWCHAETAARMGHADRHLGDGDRLTLAGTPPMNLEVLHTPGHARGHLSLRHVESGAVVCGDMVANGSTIVVDPPEGSMRQYLASLQRLRGLGPGTLYPAHGSPLADGAATLDTYLAHRQQRIEALSCALEAGALTLDAATHAVYQDVHPALWPIAERSALASLEWLIEERRVVRDGERFKLQAR